MLISFTLSKVWSSACFPIVLNSILPYLFWDWPGSLFLLYFGTCQSLWLKCSLASQQLSGFLLIFKSLSTGTLSSVNVHLTPSISSVLHAPHNIAFSYFFLCNSFPAEGSVLKTEQIPYLFIFMSSPSTGLHIYQKLSIFVE